ncbi:MAG: hypothetical protein WA857_04665 [Candidatus Acidiferrum sp.]
MKRQFVGVMFVLGTAFAAHAQEAVPGAAINNQNVAAVFSPSPATSPALFQPVSADSFWLVPSLAPASALTSPVPSADPGASPSPAPAPAATPAPAPDPDPRFIYGGRDDYRWQLGVGVDWMRFRSSIFNASAVGVDSSVTYFMNNWFGVEGNVATAFAPEIFQQEHVKLLVYGAGPKIAWRQNKWEPWMHAILGGAHEQPQTGDNTKNAFAVELGGGADYRFNPRFSGRLEADWVRTSFFSQSQNNFKLMGGVVFHF